MAATNEIGLQHVITQDIQCSFNAISYYKDKKKFWQYILKLQQCTSMWMNTQRQHAEYYTRQRKSKQDSLTPTWYNIFCWKQHIHQETKPCHQPTVQKLSKVLTISNKSKVLLSSSYLPYSHNNHRYKETSPHEMCYIQKVSIITLIQKIYEGLSIKIRLCSIMR